MKNILAFGIGVFLLASCSHVKLDKKEAAVVIRTAREYPKDVEYDVNMADPASATKLLNAGLEEEGLVTIDKTQKLKDIGQPIVHFTEKAKPYLLHKDPKYKNVQVVKLAEADLGEITAIQLLEDKKSATVEYTIIHNNITPFSKLIQQDLSRPKVKRANLSLFDSGWKLDKSW
jgi:hypothetical protein